MLPGLRHHQPVGRQRRPQESLRPRWERRDVSGLDRAQGPPHVHHAGRLPDPLTGNDRHAGQEGRHRRRDREHRHDPEGHLRADSKRGRKRFGAARQHHLDRLCLQPQQDHLLHRSGCGIRHSARRALLADHHHLQRQRAVLPYDEQADPRPDEDRSRQELRDRLPVRPGPVRRWRPGDRRLRRRQEHLPRLLRTEDQPRRRCGRRRRRLLHPGRRGVAGAVRSQDTGAEPSPAGPTAHGGALPEQLPQGFSGAQRRMEPGRAPRGHVLRPRPERPRGRRGPGPHQRLRPTA